MRDYIILTDSCCDFPAEMVEELGAAGRKGSVPGGFRNS